MTRTAPDLKREILFDRKPGRFAPAGVRERLTEAETLAPHGATTEGA